MPAEVVFHFNVDDPVGYTARFVRKVHRLGHPVNVYCDATAVSAISQWLWTHDTQGFIPHASCLDPDRVQARSPVWIGDHCPPRSGVLIRIGGVPVDPLDTYIKVIHVVGLDPDSRAEGRALWRHYQSLGHRPTGHDVTQLAPSAA